jgi:hypothetical protein
MLKLSKMRRRHYEQKKFQCDFCPTRNSWVKVIKVRDSKHLMCPECIAELAKQCRKEKEISDAAAIEKRLQKPKLISETDPSGGIGDQPIQTETPADAS